LNSKGDLQSNPDLTPAAQVYADEVAVGLDLDGDQFIGELFRLGNVYFGTNILPHFQRDKKQGIFKIEKSQHLNGGGRILCNQQL
jgi:hypothetical protein